MTRDELIAALDAGRDVAEAAMDEIVRASHDEAASSVNGGGLEDQVDYLLAGDNSPEEVDALYREILKAMDDTDE